MADTEMQGEGPERSLSELLDEADRGMADLIRGQETAVRLLADWLPRQAGVIAATLRDVSPMLGSPVDKVANAVVKALLAAADVRPPAGSRRVDSLNEAELKHAGIAARWNEEPGVLNDEARFYDAAGNELEPEHCVDLPAADVRPPAEERDDLDDYIAEVRTKDPAFGAAYDDAVARLLRDHPSALAAVATKALSAPLAAHYPGDGQAAVELTTLWSVRLPGSRFPVGTTRDEAKARQVLAEWRAERQEAGATGPEPELIRRLVSEWVPADASTPEEHDRMEAGR